MRKCAAFMYQACLPKWQLVMPGLKNLNFQPCTSLPAKAQKLVLWTPQLSLDRSECMPAAQFEVISVDNQQALPTPLPLLTALYAPGDRSRPPRPAVRLSTQSYGTARQSRRQSHGDPPHVPHPGLNSSTGEYQDMALLPVSEPSHADAGHFYPTLPGAHAMCAKLRPPRELSMRVSCICIACLVMQRQQGQRFEGAGCTLLCPVERFSMRYILRQVSSHCRTASHRCGWQQGV